MTTLRDALADAISKAETNEPTAATTTEVAAATEASAAPPAPEEKQSEGRSRDEHGRFAKSDPAPIAKPEATPPVATTTARKPPSSWKKDYWTHWEKLGTDPEMAKLQEYIEQREGDYAKGVSTYKAQWDQAAPLVQAIQPFMPELQQHNIQPAQWISNLGAAHRALALGSPEQKLAMFAKLATEYGVPLQALQTGQIDPQFSHVAQTVSNLERQMQAYKDQQAAAEQARMQQEIEAFAKNAPHFEAVKGTMAQLLQSSVAPDLKTAYDKAIRLHDDVWQQEQARQAKEAEAARQAEVAKKKAAAVSPKSSSPTGAMTAGGGKKGLRDVLSEAVESHSSGRF